MTNLPYHRVVRLLLRFALFSVFIIHNAHAVVPANLLYGVRAVSNGLVVRSADVTDSKSSQDLVTVTRHPKERVNAFFQLPNGKLAVTKTNVTRLVKQRARLTTLGSPEAITDITQIIETKIKGLAADSSVSSLVSIKPTVVIALISHLADTPPYRLATINVQSGTVKVLTRFSLPDDARFGNLTLCPDGNLYATSLAPPQGSAQLVRLDLTTNTVAAVSRLSFNNGAVFSDLKGLACSTSNQLYGLGDFEYRGINSLLLVDIPSGTMSPIGDFDVDKILFPSSAR